MKRQRSLPWLHHWSRPLMAGIATVGAVGTAYLTAVQLAQVNVACPTSGCDAVLLSPYAIVFDLPLTLFGFLAYVSMMVFAVAPLLVNSAKNKKLRSKLEKWTGLLLFVGGTAMLVFSCYLMYLLAFELQAICIYCVASALFSVSLFILALINHGWQDIRQLFFMGTVVGMLVLVGTLGIYANVNHSSSATQGDYQITTTSDAAEIALVQHLKQVGAKMYGKFWCGPCHEQKQMFGQAAWSQINYIECDPKGKNPRPDLCQAAKIKGTPTWEINARFYLGTQSLEKLADLSSYQGSRNFQNPSSHVN